MMLLKGESSIWRALPIIVFVPLSILAALAFLRFWFATPKMPREVTLDEIQQCYISIALLEHQSGQTLGQMMLHTAKTTGRINEGFTLLLRTNGLFPSIKHGIKSGTTSSELVDAWGRPLLFGWRDEMPDPQYNFLKTNVNMPLIIWSAGQNGTNEFGAGDDIVYPAASSRLLKTVTAELDNRNAKTNGGQ